MAQAGRFRRNRGAYISVLIERCVAERGECRIIDIGGEAGYWAIFPPEYLLDRHVKITLVNPSSERIGRHDAGIFEVYVGDGCDLPFGDASFDLAHSNSVIEHVGDWQRMVAFANQTRRVARYYYVQMPYFWCPFEPHFQLPFFHWLPESTRVKLVSRLAFGHYGRASDVGEAVAIVQDARLLDRIQFAFLFPDADILTERLFGVAKSLMAIRGSS